MFTLTSVTARARRRRHFSEIDSEILFKIGVSVTKVVTFEDIKILVKTEWGLSTVVLQIASVFSNVCFMFCIAGEGIFEQQRKREDISAYQCGILDRKGCHTPLNKFFSCDYKRRNIWLRNHSVSTAFDWTWLLIANEKGTKLSVAKERNLGTDLKIVYVTNIIHACAWARSG